MFRTEKDEGSCRPSLSFETVSQDRGCVGGDRTVHEEEK